ncbi:1-phosphofructokinase family hexose kinase [Bdellovibrio svalbardensis]|uniref:1-phosphofructokinase family hexose kinase n=1 Tax=Bdellovibrio svalbardensis TaxID=2972972 RepID=A0ABT6DMS5_9BACT|nr:1-phosphofructokinase family hexose kinase [Bdellovibrio svalbardensis]MDG0818168.1 1-phosphofructokinase family hexose kinase [Bdellovibrio svalbardensis]
MKKTVCTITPNPALDLSGTVRNIKPNEKCYVFDEQRAPGGNSINSARILNRLNIPVIASGFLGGSTGDEIHSLLDREKLRNHFIHISDSTRINVTVSNQHDHKQTRLSFPGPTIRRDEKQQLFELVSKNVNISLLVMGGSLPKGFTPKDLLHIMRLAQSRGIEVIIDSPGEILAQVVSGKPLLIKPNLEEFQTLTKSRVTTISSVIKKAKEKLPMVSLVCVSSVEGGAVLITPESSFFGKIPRIKIRSTVGAGDSMVGAMVAQLYQGNTSAEELLKWGLAAAAATLSHPGTSLGRASEMQHFYELIHVERQ